jgi:Ca2+-binding RTX toxin-like protein
MNNEILSVEEKLYLSRTLSILSNHYLNFDSSIILGNILDVTIKNLSTSIFSGNDLNILNTNSTFEANNLVIVKGDENNSIIVNGTNNIVFTGEGNDIINAGIGNHSYIYRRGDGTDIINDLGGIDKIIFDANISRSDVELSVDGDTLILGIKKIGLSIEQLTDKIIISNYLLTENRIEEIKFSNGDIIKYDEVLYAVGINDNDNVIVLDSLDNYIDSKGGNDTIKSLAGNDVLDGGTGNDTLYGGEGNDTYVFGRGYGQDNILDIYTYYGHEKFSGTDTIKIKDGLTVNDVIFKQSGNDLIIAIKEDGIAFEDLVNKLTITNWNDINYSIENIVFDDGTILTQSNVRAIMDTSNDDVISTSVDSYDAGNDVVYGGDGNDIITTRKGNDVLDGGTGNDTLYGGEGNDILYGGEGIDTFIINRGDGNDIIIDSMGKTIISYGVNIIKSELSFTKESNDLIILINNTNDSVTIKNWFINLNELELQFSNLSKITFNEILIKFADENSEFLNSTDILYSQAQVIMRGESGDDTYIYNKGDFIVVIDDTYLNSQGNLLNGGFDTLYLNGGINSSDVIFNVYGNDLILKINNNESTYGELKDYVIIKNWKSANNGVEKIVFSDGEELFLSKTEIFATTTFNTSLIPQTKYMYGFEDNLINGTSSNETIYSKGGNDTIKALAGNDVLDGGTGNDILEGGAGNDTYIFGRGYGHDTIKDEYYTYKFNDAGIDQIKFNAGVTVTDLIFQQDGNNLVIGIKEDGVSFANLADKLTIANWQDIFYSIENFTFSNGSILSKAEVQSLMIAPNNDVITTGDGNDIIYSKDGNDTISTGLGNDILDGGNGDDVLNGMGGNDTYIFGRGYGHDTIKDEYYTYKFNDAGIDQIKFKDDILKEDISFIYDGNNLKISYSDNDEILIINQKNSNYAIEKVELSNGNYLSNNDIANIIQQMNTYAQNNGIDMTNTQAVRNNENLMAIIHNSWNVA